jgi:putative addiction module component (TIGR02574 family)
MSTDELIAEALQLPRPERARLAQELLFSLEESDEAIAAAWVAELDRRLKEIAEGTVQPVGWDTARTEILRRLEEGRARRAAS